MKRFVRAAAALGAIGALYLAVSLLLAPWAEPEQEADPHGAFADFTPASAAPREELSSLFPADSWVRNGAKVVETDDALLLFQDYTTTEDGRLHISPLVLIYSPEPGAGRTRRPVILESPEGARVQFDRPLDLRQAEVGKLVGARLEGMVHIYQPAEDGPGNALEIHTRNVQIDRQRIWTPNEVAFRAEGHYGRGKDLLITLSQKASTAPSASLATAAPAAGLGGRVRSVELVHVDKFHFEVDRRPGPRRQPPLEITSRGPFLLDFETQLATFEEQVDVVRLHADGASDHLHCQRLEIHLMPPRPTGIATAAPDSPAAAPGATKDDEQPPIQVRKIVAIGHPATLRVPAFGGVARGRRLEYDFQTRRVHLEDDRPVKVNYRQHQIEAIDLLYELPAVPFEQQTPESADWGRLWAKGPGIIRSRDERERELLVRWNDQLVMQPQNGEQVVSLLGSALVAAPEFGQVQAGALHLWLAPPRVSSEPAEAADGATSDFPTLQPNRLLAQQQVSVDSERFTGRTGELKAWFVDVESASEEPARRASTGRGTPAGGARPQAAEAAQQPASRYHLEGGTVQIELLRQGRETSVNAVSINGDVVLRETPLTDPGAVPLEIRGDRLQLNQVSERGGVVQVLGRPARIEARGMDLVSSNVQLDRRRNRIWIDGPGEITLPLAELPAAPAPESPDVLRKPPARGSVQWRDSLDFDGSRFRFERGVTLRTESQTAWCETLDLTLAAPLDLSAERIARPEIQEILLGGETRIENRTLEPATGRLLARDRILTRDLRLQAVTGDLQSVGPGWLRSTRVQGASSNLAGLSNFGGAGSAPTDRANAPGLMHLYVQFDRGITGNARRREVHLHQQVRAMLVPVQHWEQEPPLLAPDQLEGQAVTLACDRLSVVDMGGAGQAYEVTAAGNTVVEARTFTARANRLSYAQAKQLLVLEGDGHTNAELWRQTRIGGASSHAAARKILYWHGTNQIEVEDAQVFDFSEQLGTGGPLPRFIEPPARTAVRPR